MSKPTNRKQPTDLEILASLADWAKKTRENYHMEPLSDALDDGVGLVKRLCAEAERLTPREMTLQDACDVLNERRHCGESQWMVAGSLVVLPRQYGHSLYDFEAKVIAQGLERDAAKGGA